MLLNENDIEVLMTNARDQAPVGHRVTIVIGFLYTDWFSRPDWNDRIGGKTRDGNSAVWKNIGSLSVRELLKLRAVDMEGSMTIHDDEFNWRPEFCPQCGNPIEVKRTSFGPPTENHAGIRWTLYCPQCGLLADIDLRRSL